MKHVKDICEGYPCEECEKNKTSYCYSACKKYREWLKEAWEKVCSVLRRKEDE